MISLLWNLSAALRAYLRFHMPTNQAVHWLRTPRGLRWGIPVALIVALAYLFAMSVCVTVLERGGPGYLNVLVILFFWNAMKFAWLAVLLPGWSLLTYLSDIKGMAHTALRRAGAENNQARGWLRL